MKYKGRVIVGIYILSVLFYGVFVSVFTSTVHAGVDEEIYVGLARSFHYQGRFETGGELADYTCVLYSVLISLAYYLYSPEHILFIMRLTGVLVMCSAVFPVFLLAERLLGDEKKALKISVFSLLLPYMSDTAYLMQEVLSYPLFCWMIYFFCCSCGVARSRKGDLCLIVCSFFSVLCYFTKTYMFFIPIVLNLVFIYDRDTGQKRKEGLRKLAVFDTTYILLTVILYILIKGVNGFEAGSDHYQNQIMSLFPINWNTITLGITGVAVYISMLFWNMGMIPLFSLFIKNKESEEQIKKVAFFCKISLVFLVFEIVTLIVLTEDRGELLPRKFLFRYFQVFVPIVWILFEKTDRNTTFLKKRKVWCLSALLTGIPVIYFCYMQGNTRQSIIDGHYFLLLENMTKYLIPYADAVLVCLFGILLAWIIWMECRGGKKRSRWWQWAVAAAIFVMSGINCVQLPFYTNVIADGKVIQNDSIKIANYLNSGDYECVYYISGDDYYTRNFYGYIRQPYKVIEEDELAQYIDGNDEKIGAVIVSGNSEQLKGEIKKEELGTKKLTLYTFL